jgi:RND family efflux transporter MFP subunit
MASTSREEIAALSIERPDRKLSMRNGEGKLGGGRRGGGLGILSWLLWLIPLALLASAGTVAWRQIDQLRPRPEVTKVLVEEKPAWKALSLFEAKAYLKSRFQAMIGTKVAGRVERMYVEEGMRVKKGDTLAVIEHNDLKAMLASREAQALRTAAELEEARADLWEKEREERRAIRLFAKKSITVEEQEKATATQKMAVARVAALEAAVKLMKANVDETRATIATMFLYAPFDGTVVTKQGEEGEVITPMAMSSSLGRTAVVTIANLERMDAEAEVREGLLSKIAVGQPAIIEVAATAPKVYRGRLRHIVPMSDRASTNVKVKVEISNPDEKLFPELAALVYFLPATTDAADSLEGNRKHLFVNTSALFRQEDQDYAWVIDKASVIHRRRVVVARTAGAMSQIESGLAKGESVVLNPGESLHEGQTVRTGR